MRCSSKSGLYRESCRTQRQNKGGTLVPSVWIKRRKKAFAWPRRFEQLESRTLFAAFVVNTFDDTVDANPGDGLALDSQGRTSLRSAVMEANASPGEDSVTLPEGSYQFTLSGGDEQFAQTGDLDVRDDLAVFGAGAHLTVIDAASADRLFDVIVGTHLRLESLTLTRGRARASSGYGSAVSIAGSVMMADVIVSDSHAEFGGGSIAASPGSVLHINRSIITGNTAAYGGGGLSIYGNAQVVIENSAITNNAADNGGGIHSSYPRSEPAGGTLIVNTTISGNRAIFSGGGIVYTNFDSPMTLVNCTITDNSSQEFGGGGVSCDAPGMSLQNTIVAGNSSIAPDLFAPNFAPVSLGNNLVGDGSSQTGLIHGQNHDQVGSSAAPIDAGLGPLADHGGPTPMHAIGPGSPALDAGKTENAPAVDQRGLTRPRDGDGDGEARHDVGAFEYMPPIEIRSARGNEDSAIPLFIDVRSDVDAQSFVVSGAPAGATLSAGVEAGSGVWIVSRQELSGLSIIPPTDSDSEFTLTVTAASLPTIEWSEADGGNGHTYALVMPDLPANSWSWTSANASAQQQSDRGVFGHLATIQNSAEHEFLGSHFQALLSDSQPLGARYAWIGLYASTPTANFEWVTGDPITFTAWAPHEPNFYGQPLWQHVHYWTRDFGAGPSWTWNNEQDAGSGVLEGERRFGYIVEFDGPFSNQLQADFRVQVDAVADAPELSAPTTLTMQEGAWADLVLDAQLVDVDGSESLRIELRGIPSGVAFRNSAGPLTVQNGVVVLNPAELAGLQIAAPDDLSFAMEVAAISTESQPTSIDLTVGVLSATSVREVAIEVANTAPRIDDSSLGIVSGSSSTSQPVTLSLSFVDAGFDTESFEYEIDWGDGHIATGSVTSVEDGNYGVVSRGAIQVSHVYAAGGLFPVQASIRDDDGGEDFSATAEATVVGAGIREGVLYIVGNDLANTIKVDPPNGSQVKVTTAVVPGGALQFPEAGFSSLHILGRGGNDVITVSGKLLKNAFIDGGAGSDTLTGGGANDILLGGAGNDKLTGKLGADFISGGLGSDTWTVEGGSAADRIFADWDDQASELTSERRNASGLLVEADRAVEVEQFTINGLDGDDVIDLSLLSAADAAAAGLVQLTVDGGGGGDAITGSGRGDTLLGGSGRYRDVIRGGDGADVLDGGDGDDQLFGEGGNDSLKGKAGHDALDGGDGFDTWTFEGTSSAERIIVAWDAVRSLITTQRIDLSGVVRETDLGALVEALVVNAAAGDDEVDLSALTEADAALAGLLQTSLNGGGGADTLRGSALRDTITGGDGIYADTLYGGGGDDVLDGGDGQDRLFGESGNDRLLGKNHDDLLDGGEGDDYLDGGSGIDTALNGEVVVRCEL